MIKYFKDYMGGYQYAEYLQTAAVLLFVIFFLAVFAIVFLKPKDYYKEVSHLPLEEDTDLPQNSN